jgi:hypothetical protein
MPRKTSAARLAEFRILVDFAGTMRLFFQRLHPGAWDDKLPDGTSYFEGMTAMAERMLAEGAVPSQVQTGWKQAVADMLEMTRDWRPEVIAAADKFLVDNRALSLTTMRRRIWRVIPRVLARGRIRNIDEFYVVKNVISDDGDDLSRDDRARLRDMCFDFEMRPHARRS